MTEQVPESPAAGAAPVPDFPQVTSPPSAQEAPVAAEAGQDPSARAAELETELAQVRAQALAGDKATAVVRPPHSAFTFAGLTVGDTPTPVPARMLGALLTAAAEAGVTIEEVS